MTYMEIILTACIWVIVGFWIAHKRGWYKGQRFVQLQPTETDRVLRIVLGIVASPISLLSAFISEFVIRDWENEK